MDDQGGPHIRLEEYCAQYRVCSWTKYVQIHANMSEWDSDSRDPFEQALSQSTFGSQRQKEFYRDFTAYDHHDAQPSTKVRGWNIDECSYLQQRRRSDGEKLCSVQVSAEQDAHVQRRLNLMKVEAKPKSHSPDQEAEFVKGEYKTLDTCEDNTEDNSEDSDCQTDDEEVPQEDQQKSILLVTKDGAKSKQSKNPEQETEFEKVENNTLDTWRDDTDNDGEDSDYPTDDKGVRQQDLYKSIYVGKYGVKPKNSNCNDKEVRKEDLQKSIHVAKCGAKPKDSNSDDEVRHEDLQKSIHIGKYGAKLKDSNSDDKEMCQEEQQNSIHIAKYGAKLKDSNSDDKEMRQKEQQKSIHIVKDGAKPKDSKVNPPVFGQRVTSIEGNKDASRAFKILQVCREYNEQGCAQSNCNALHICISYVAEGTRCSHNCKLNHDLLTPFCCILFKRHGISIQTSQQEMRVNLLKNNTALAALAQPAAKATESTQKPFTVKQGNQTADRIQNDNFLSYFLNRYHYDFSNITDFQKVDDNVQNPPQYSKYQSKNDIKSSGNSRTFNSDDGYITMRKGYVHSGKGRKAVQQTIWFDDFEGNLKTPEICLFSVTGNCRYESIGCRRLHANQHYHWQISEQDDKWLNLPLSQVDALEQAFCDPAQESVSLPRLEQQRISNPMHQLLSVLGRGSWAANFEAMILIDSSQSKLFFLRRLCTEKVQGHTIKSNNFLWYFLDKNSKWVQYGKVDTTGQSNMVSSVTSDDIEQHFDASPNVPLTFQNSSFTYTLNFSGMFQTNKNTGVHRQICRRPELDCSKHVQDSIALNSACNSLQTLKVGSSHSDLPSSWETMLPKERFRRVVLSASSAEYQKVVGLLSGRISPGNVKKIERIQNPCLWRAFQNKISDMTIIHGDISKVDVRQLFHGTRHEVVDNIINENFDWRLHGTSTGQVHGRGTYFSTDASQSYNYSASDRMGNKYLFVVRVAVGSITQGNASMARPPMNPVTKIPFDSTGSGSIIVKYDKQEYYPEYIIIFSK